MEKYLKNIKTILLLALVASSAVVWYAVLYYESRQDLMVTFFDIGQGDAIFIEVPGGNQVLIDGGPNDAILAKLGRVLPFWDRTVDLLILTHPHADHLAGLLEVLKRYEVGMVMESGVNHSIAEYKEWRSILQKKAVPVVIAKTGQKVRLSRSSYIDVFTPFESFEGESPKNIHEATVVSKLVYASTTVLLMGDAERSIEYRLLFSGIDIDADILKVGHHGSKTSTSEEFLAAVSPRIAVIQSGKKNRFGHPYQEVLERLKAIGAEILRNDLRGDIQLKSDGVSFILSTR